MRDIFIISASKCKHHFNLNKNFPLPSSMVLFTFPSFVKQISVKSLSDILPPPRLGGFPKTTSGTWRESKILWETNLAALGLVQITPTQ